MLRLAALVLLVLATSVAPATADDSRAIMVGGEGTVRAVPDMAELIAGVQTRAPAARTALDRNNAEMEKVMAALRQAGVAAADLQTSQFSVSPTYERSDRGMRRMTGYQAVNRVTVKVRDIATVGTLLDAAVSAGANDVQGVRFTIAEPGKLMDEARRRAVADAMRRARLLAAAAGVKLGAVRSIDERGIQAPRPLMMAADAARAAPVAPGEQEIRARLTVRFAVE